MTTQQTATPSSPAPSAPAAPRPAAPRPAGPRPGAPRPGAPRQGGAPAGGRPPFRSGGFQRRRGRPRYYARRKICSFCVDKITHIDYKDVARLRRFISDRYKLEARRKTGVCAKHQRALSRAVKRARAIALIPYSPDHKMPGGGYAS